LASCFNRQTQAKFERVVPLIQDYQAPKTNRSSSSKVNVILLGIDSISRLQFLRHLTRSKKFVDQQGFIPMYGYHKVGENSFPNVLPILTGHHQSYFVSDSPNVTFNWDDYPFVFREYQQKGYLTTFI